MNVFMRLCCLLTVIFCCTENVNGEVENDLRQSILDPSNVDYLVSQNSSSNSSVCLTPGCIKAAEEVLLNLNETVDPCDDFYSFACGGWLNRHTIPENKSKIHVFSKLQSDLDMKLRVLLQKNLTGSEPEFIKMAKSMYYSCMDVESIENFGAKPLKKILEKLGGWPVVEGNKWNGSNFDWIDTLIACRNLGCDHNILLDLSVLADKQKKNHFIYLEKGYLGMRNKISLARGLNDNNTVIYYTLMIKSAILLGADEATVENELRKTLDFEIALANLSLTKEERYNGSDMETNYTVAKLQNEFPQIPWLKYFNGLLVDEILENETLETYDPDFFSKLSDLITEADKRVVANYMLWRIVLEFIPMLSKEWVDLSQEHKYQFKKEEELSRWEQCLASVKRRLKIAIGSLYVKEYFKKESKDGVSELAKYIRSEFNEILDETDWMDNQTKKQAKKKADAMKIHIGYPEELLNDTAVQELYQNLEITTESYFENVMRWNKWFTDFFYKRLRKPNIEKQWTTEVLPVLVNAMYWFYQNAVDLPVGILENPFFNTDRPHYMNFGAIGFIIGHEIAHGLGGESRHVDAEGNTVDWWSNASLDSFKAKTQCIIDQYSNYTVENEMNLNGKKTLHENMADYGGLKTAYLAYQSWLKNNREEEPLPRMKFTQNQMFWISAANIYCGKYLPEKMKSFIESETHSPLRFRIIGPISNLPEFAKDFNCSPDSAMNKKEKCDVWGK